MLLRLLPPAFRDGLAQAQPPAATPVGWVCFQIGLFLLASSALLGGVFLFVALILGSRDRERLRYVYCVLRGGLAPSRVARDAAICRGRGYESRH
jgi:hypothetical protein